MLNIGKKGQTCVIPRNKLGNDSLKRALDVAGQDCAACSATEQCDSSVSLLNGKQMHDSLTYQIEAEQKRALGMMYTNRNTFR